MRIDEVSGALQKRAIAGVEELSLPRDALLGRKVIGRQCEQSELARRECADPETRGLPTNVQSVLSNTMVSNDRPRAWSVVEAGA